MILKAIPWQIIGPAAAAAVVILAVVFWFMLRWQKGAKTNPSPPKDINATGKKTLCFQHHGDIARNQTAIKMIGDQLEKTQEQNSEQHGKIFDKMEDLKTTIIKEIHKVNSGQ